MPASRRPASASGASRAKGSRVHARIGERAAALFRAAGAGERPAGGSEQRAEGACAEAVAEAEEPPGRRHRAHTVGAGGRRHSASTCPSRSAGAWRARSASQLGGRREAGCGPDRHGPHQGRGVAEQPPGRRQDRRISAIADGDQHVADEAVAPDALDRAAGEDRAEGRIVQLGKVGEPGRAQLGARQEGVAPWCGGRTCSRDTPRGSRRSRRSGCPWPRGIRGKYGPCARW